MAAPVKTLFDRIGGEGAIHAAVQGLYLRLLENPALDVFFQDVDVNMIKWHQQHFLRLAFTKVPEGVNLVALLNDAHARLWPKGLDETHFDMVATALVETLHELTVPQELIDEVICVVGPLRAVFEECALLNKVAAPKKSGKSRNSAMPKKGAEETVRVRFAVLGDSAVGKTSFCSVVCEGYFPQGQYQPTEEAEQYQCQIPTGKKTADVTFDDMPSGTDEQEVFDLEFDGAIVMYSIDNSYSWESAKEIITNLRNADKNIPIAIVGAKLDLEKKRAVEIATVEECMKTMSSSPLFHAELSSQALTNMTAIVPSLVRASCSNKGAKKCVVM